jgi:integrase
MLVQHRHVAGDLLEILAAPDLPSQPKSGCLATPRILRYSRFVRHRACCNLCDRVITSSREVNESNCEYLDLANRRLTFRSHDLRHWAITQLAENCTSDSSIMAPAGHVSRHMLERCSHVRMEAKRTAMEALAVSTKTAGYDTNHDTNCVPAGSLPV